MIFKKFLTITLILTIPLAADARNSNRIDRSDLDDDIVDEFPIPVLFGVDFDDLVPDFGDSRGGGTREHEGQDMRAPEGTPIVSPTEAIVIRTGTGDSAGKYVYTANPGGETFRYMHLDYIADLDPGDKLDVGGFIGTVGDTGNAPDEVYHLHFEVRNSSGPTDPYERFDEDGFTVKEKMSFLRGIFSDIRNDSDYAEFLIENFSADFMTALEKDYSLPSVIDNALEDSGAVDEAENIESLTDLIVGLPAAIPVTLENGDSGALVILLQIYLIYTGEGEARDRLFLAGPTGYFGTITEEALLEHQREYLSVYDKGVYNPKTQEEMLDRDNIELNLSL